ncbi:MAG: hypothetical protein QXX34_06905 [Candidatus Bathyarchaeia archaeon]
MKKLAKLLLIFGAVTIIAAVLSFIDVINTTPVIRGYALTSMILWVGVGITEIIVAYIYNEKLS